MKSQLVVFSLIATASAALAKNVPTNAAANLVLGQKDFVTEVSGFVRSSFTFSDPSAVAIDPVTGKVFVADGGFNRILRFASYKSLKNFSGAEAVFGQAQFSTSSSAGGTQGLSSVRGIHLDRLGRLWVADAGNNRILMYEAAVYRGNQPAADKVIGQPDFTTVSANTNAAKLSFPESMFVDSEDRLWVSDYLNNRVLRYDAISSKGNGPTADGVLGQATFLTGGSGSGSSGFNEPFGLAVSSTGTLYVGLRGNNRVLVFENAKTLGNGAGASKVLGQPDFATTTAGVTANKMDSASGVTLAAGDTLWVTDQDNSRILRFDKVSTKASGAAANGVIGQPDLVTGTGGLTSRTLDTPFFATTVDPSGNLWVPDNGNDRVLRFPADATQPTLVVSTVPKTTSESKLTIKGTVTDANGISSVQYKVNSGSLKNATQNGAGGWQFKANLAPGKNKITVYATDTAANKASKVLNVTRK